MINNNYTNFWNDIQRQTSIVDDVDTKPEPVKIVNKQEQKKVDGMKKRFDELFN